MGLREIEIVTYAHAADNEPNHLTLTEEDFVTLLTEHDDTDCTYPCAKCEFKNGLAWSPGVIQPGRRRGGANVAYLDVLAYDFDHLMPSTLQSLLERLDDERVLVYSTHRHTPEAPRVRVVFFLSRRITPQEFRTLHASVAAHFGLTELLDKKCKDASHLYFFPTSPRGAPRIGVYNDEGRYLDVDKHIVAQQLRTMERQRAPDLGQQEEPEAVDLGSLRARLARYNPQDDFDGQKREFVRRMRAGEALADKGGRDDAIHRTASILAWNLPLNTPVEAAMELIRPSIMAIPQYDDDGPDENPDGWMRKAEYSFTKTAEKKLAEAEERNLFLAALNRKRAQAPPTPKSSVPTQQAPVSALLPPPAPSASPGSRDSNWRAMLQMKHMKSGEVVVERVPMNMTVALQNCPEWENALRFNVLKNEVEAIGGPLTVEERHPDQLPVAMQNWMTEYVCSLTLNDVQAQMEFIARFTPYDPIQSYLDNLVWDGVKRLDAWLEAYCGAKPEAPFGRMWMVGGVARAKEPGCKMDNVLVLEGGQNAGKSAMLRILGGEWFSEAKSALAHRDTMELTARSWVIELPELSAMRRSETEAHKAFFSANDDRFRLAYARRVADFKRRCIFAGSTNEDEYLQDDTGNRRYWPVYCREFNLEALRRDRDQLWAEAVAVYNASTGCPACAAEGVRCKEHRWWFNRDESEALEHITTARLKSDFSDALYGWWMTKEPKDRPEHVTAHFVAAQVLGLSAEKVESQRQAIGRTLKHCGFTRRQVQRGDGRIWAYFPSETWKNTPKTNDPSRRLQLAVSNAAKPEEKA